VPRLLNYVVAIYLIIVGIIGLAPLLQLDPSTSIDRAVERFGDRRGYLYFCGLGASLLAKGLIRPAAAEQGTRSY